MVSYTNRVLVSFSGKCPLECKHCYTLDFDCPKTKQDMDEIDQIVASIRNSSFDIIYVSHDRENFIDEQAGIRLVESLYETYQKSMLIITRKNLAQDTVRQLAELSEKMADNNQTLFIAVSIPANASYGITEKTDKIATPSDRCELLFRLHQSGIKTILLARPIFPNSIIPTSEITGMISDYHDSIDAVVASGLAVNDTILERLGLSGKELNYLPGNNKEFLIGSSAKDIKYLDVHSELAEIENTCKDFGIVFSTHSMDALNQLKAVISI
ncbi:hypothetical protein JNO48_10555 [Clostridiales bacterium]|nr:hypothetical protein JNO48_10555 [Clostridiales bacterium]